MRIDDLNLNRTADTQGAEKLAPASQQRAADKQAVAVAGADQAEVSQLAQSLAATDPTRIDQLRLQVQSGSYNVSAEEVAGALIDAHLTG